MRRPHILVVEDEPVIADVLKQYLEKQQYDVSVLNSGNTVVSFVRVKPVDLLLLDVGLPDKDGITLYHEIRAFSEVPILLIIEKNEDVDRLLGLNIAKDVVVRKPFLPGAVVKQVNAILSNRE